MNFREKTQHIHGSAGATERLSGFKQRRKINERTTGEKTRAERAAPEWEEKCTVKAVGRVALVVVGILADVLTGRFPGRTFTSS
ncbi:hypothetical protein KM043_007405 [Ampulex compressa]|nr:hypothetical protein KM043_007405 [Ampulex compressa]